MVLLYSLTLACLVGLSQHAELFSEKCCSKKNVGGVDYTQIPGDTTGFPDCKAGCVYERDDTPGSRYCFSTGNASTDKPAMCTESTSTITEVSVTRNSDNLSFESPDGPLTCNIKLSDAAGEKFKEITCNNDASGSEQQNTENATLISSVSANGALEWISLHTMNNEWVHCNFTSVVMNCSVCTDCIGDFNILYVEGTDDRNINQSASLTEQLIQCNTTCLLSSDTCKFWSFSYYNPHSHPRFHDGKSQCGLRNYDACCLIETNQDQWYGIPSDSSTEPIPTPNPIQNMAAVWKKKNNVSNYYCFFWCLQDRECRTWTWETEKNACALNNYIPTRKLKIGFVNNPKPNLYSGCFSTGFDCDTLQPSGSD